MRACFFGHELYYIIVSLRQAVPSRAESSAKGGISRGNVCMIQDRGGFRRERQEGVKREFRITCTPQLPPQLSCPLPCRAFCEGGSFLKNLFINSCCFGRSISSSVAA